MRKTEIFRKIASFFIIFCSFFTLNAQSGTKLMIEEDDDFLLQASPIYEGVAEFEEKLNLIRENENREPMGLVLCGGSARAFAHIGALKAMEENKIIPDFIIANSMGAIIGMFYAYGFSPDKILEVVSNINLTQYFEPVLPIHGGILSVRKFRAFVNDLLGKPQTDLSECPIPILVVTEDLYSKRQIWHSSGDFAKIMTAAFGIPAIMEPTNYHLNDDEKTKVKLLDSGAIDIASLSVAEYFSKNIIISTAFYDSVLNYNNIIVVLNRLMAIGKERQAAIDIKSYKPVIIRNDVEHFSFMAFDKSDELSKIGYESTLKVIDEIKKCPHSFKNYSERRNQTNEFANNAISHALKNETILQDETYFGLKIWPVFPVIDYPDYNLFNSIGISAFSFLDSSKIFLSGGIFFPIKNKFSVNTNFTFKPSSVFEFSLLTLYSFKYKNFQPSDFYTASNIKFRPSTFPYEFKSFFLTSEYSANYDLKPQEMLFKLGANAEFKNDKKFYVSIKPYYFLSGSEIKNLSSGVGMNLQTMINASCFSKKEQNFTVGLSENFSTRYAFFNFEKSAPKTRIYSSDFYRTTKPSEYNNFVLSNDTELYFANLNPSLTFAELIIVQQWKIGGFFDELYNKQIYLCAGGFFRGKFSLIGLYDFVLEAGCGWNITKQNFFGYFEMKNRI